MSINLSKGQKIDLTKGNSGLKKLLIGLGWDTNKYDGGHEFDLDACAALRTNGECTSDKRFVYFGNLKSENDSVIHTGDNLTGKGDGDDEQIKVDLTLLDEDIDEISFNIVIYQAESRQQNFGQISNAFVRVVNEETNEELARFDLGEEVSTSTRMELGKLYKHQGEWKFTAIGGGKSGGFDKLLEEIGLS